jgi:flagellin
MTSILTNTSAMAALQTLRMIGSSMAETQRQVSSGLRVQIAADNAAYWSISTTMRSDNMALSAVVDALGLGAAKIDVAYAGMEAVSDVLAEFKAKLVAATEDGVDKAKIQTELDQLKQQVVGIATSASFNGVNWLNTDIADINDSDLNKVSLTSSFSRSGGGVSVGTIDFHLSEAALFNENGGGILQADTRKMKTLGGIREWDTYMDALGVIHMDKENGEEGYYGQLKFDFSGPLVFGATDTISFDITVDADDPSALAPPHNPGKTTHIVIDRTFVDKWGGANGVISDFEQYTSVLYRALTLANSGAAATEEASPTGGKIPNRIVISSREASGLDGSYVKIENLVSSFGATGNLAEGEDFGEPGSDMELTFQPFEVYTDGDNRKGVEVGFHFSVNGKTPSTHSFDRTYVNALLGKANGKVETAAEMVTLLKSLISVEWPDVIIEETGTGKISMRTDKTVDRLNGFQSRIGFTDIAVSIEPLAELNFLDIDIVANPDMLGTYLGYIETVSADVIGAGATLGALKSRVDMQTTFARMLTDRIDQGIGRLVDADMNEASTRLKALQTQEQLATQALQIANSDAENIMQLFR